MSNFVCARCWNSRVKTLERRVDGHGLSSRIGVFVLIKSCFVFDTYFSPAISPPHKYGIADIFSPGILASLVT